MTLLSPTPHPAERPRRRTGDRPPARRRPASAAVALVTLLCAALLAPVLDADPAGAAAGTGWQHEMLERVNAERDRAGVAPLRLCPRLDTAAQQHSEYMRDTDAVTHTGAGGSDVGDRAHAAGYHWTRVGENVAGGYYSVSSVMHALLSSPAHRERIVDPGVRHLGVGLATSNSGYFWYWTQVFGDGGSCGGWYPFGNLESVRGGTGTATVHGWALDPDAGTSPIDVTVRVDGANVATFPADLYRPDVADHYPYGPHHGFDRSVAAPPGSRSICVIARNAGPGNDVPLGCEQVWVADPASPFVDVLSSHTFFDEIAALADAGIVGGYRDGTFRPGDAVSRQAIAAFLWRAAGSPPGPFPDPGFHDVDADHVFATPIAWMAAEGIATGYDDGTFRPERTVSRQATAAFLWRAAGGVPDELLDLDSLLDDFSDVDADHPFAEPIAWSVAAAVTTGYDDGTFRPGRTVTRQATAAFLDRWLHAVG